MADLTTDSVVFYSKDKTQMEELKSFLNSKDKCNEKCINRYTSEKWIGRILLPTKLFNPKLMLNDSDFSMFIEEVKDVKYNETYGTYELVMKTYCRWNLKPLPVFLIKELFEGVKVSINSCLNSDNEWYYNDDLPLAYQEYELDFVGDVESENFKELESVLGKHEELGDFVDSPLLNIPIDIRNNTTEVRKYLNSIDIELTIPQSLGSNFKMPEYNGRFNRYRRLKSRRY